ncbi:hypothetical protein [Nocardia sp. NPDC004722]
MQRRRPDGEQGRDTESRIGLALLALAPDADWERVELHAAAVGPAYQLRIAAILDDGSTVIPDPAALEAAGLDAIGSALLELRRLMATYRPGTGTWFSMRLCLDSPEDYSAAYNFHHEPEWNPPLSPEAWLADFEVFPRDVLHIPAWLRAHLERAQPGQWAQGSVTVEGSQDIADQSELADEMTALLVESLPPGYEMFNLHYRAVGDHVDMDSSLVDLFMEDIDWTPPTDLLDLVGKLRAGMYQPGYGTWFTAHLRFDYISRLDIQFDWTNEPEWRENFPTQSAYTDDLVRYPRRPESAPPWLERRARQDGPVFQMARAHDGTIPVPGYPQGMPTWVDRPELSEEERASILAYLENAPVIREDSGFDADLLEPERTQAISRRYHTDGVWIWPASVAYYLREHKAPPQRPLTDHIRSKGFQPPTVDKAALAAAATAADRE